MPYPFAHPAAILPLAGPMGRFAAPSALAIGSVAPDLWYLVPGLARDDSHSLAGLFWFCLPAGALAYLAFHLLLKQPLLALCQGGRASYQRRRQIGEGEVLSAQFVARADAVAGSAHGHVPVGAEDQREG